MQIIWRLLLINAAALWAATRLVPGISFDGDWGLLFYVALVFRLVWALALIVFDFAVRSIPVLRTPPLSILTLGLLPLVLNAVMLWLTSKVSDALGRGFHVAGFGAAFLGALVVTVVFFMLWPFIASAAHDRIERRGPQRPANVPRD